MALHDTGSYFHLKESGISSQEVFNSNNKDSQGYYRAKLNSPPPKKKKLFIQDQQREIFTSRFDFKTHYFTWKSMTENSLFKELS